MPEETKPSPPAQTPPTSKSYFSTPLAIVIAGGLIAVAVYFGSTSERSNNTGTNGAGSDIQFDDKASPEVAGEQEQVGDFRPVSDQDHIRGASNPKVTLIEYSDLECPFCKRFHETTEQILEQYPNDVAIVFRHFPLAQLHSKAETEALATECAGEQGKFWELVDIIFEEAQGNDSLDLGKLPDYAEQAGVANITQFTTCLDGKKYQAEVNADLADATAAGGQGTPYSLLVSPGKDPVPINGAQPFEQIKVQIDSLL